MSSDNNEFIFGENGIGDFECNIGRVITVFTESGGCSGVGFTGLLVKADCRFIKLITDLPSAPPSPFGSCDFRGAVRDRNCCVKGRDHRCSDFGTVVIIPIKQIVAFVFNDI